MSMAPFADIHQFLETGRKGALPTLAPNALGLADNQILIAPAHFKFTRDTNPTSRIALGRAATRLKALTTITSTPGPAARGRAVDALPSLTVHTANHRLPGVSTDGKPSPGVFEIGDDRCR
jgi:hypothetical protein